MEKILLPGLPYFGIPCLTKVIPSRKLCMYTLTVLIARMSLQHLKEETTVRKLDFQIVYSKDTLITSSTEASIEKV